LEINDFNKRSNTNNILINNINSNKKQKFEEKNIDNSIMIYKKDLFSIHNSLSNSESFILNKFSVFSNLPLKEQVYQNNLNNKFNLDEFNYKKAKIKEDICKEKNEIERNFDEIINDALESKD